MTTHILSDRRLPISRSPAADSPLLPRSGFVQSAILRPNEDMARKCARTEGVGCVDRKVKCKVHFLRDKFQFGSPDIDHAAVRSIEAYGGLWFC